MANRSDEAARVDEENLMLKAQLEQVTGTLMEEQAAKLEANRHLREVQRVRVAAFEAGSSVFVCVCGGVNLCASLYVYLSTCLPLCVCQRVCRYVRTYAYLYPNNTSMNGCVDVCIFMVHSWWYVCAFIDVSLMNSAACFHMLHNGSELDGAKLPSGLKGWCHVNDIMAKAI